MLGAGNGLHRRKAEEENSEQKTPAWLTEGGNIFSVYKVVTLDPNLVMEAWDRLGQDTWPMELQSLPHVMHHSLLHTMNERGWTKG